jgi:hypothetical protein
MKARLSVATVLVAFALAGSPAFAQTGTNADVQAKLAQCKVIADPGLKAQCMEQARRMTSTQQRMRQMQQQQMPGQNRPGINSNLPPQDRRNR